MPDNPTAVPAAPQPAAAPVSDADLHKALTAFADGSHPGPHKMQAAQAGPFGPVLVNLVQALLPMLVQFLQSQFNITPKTPAA